MQMVNVMVAIIELQEDMLLFGAQRWNLLTFACCQSMECDRQETAMEREVDKLRHLLQTFHGLFSEAWIFVAPFEMNNGTR